VGAPLECPVGWSEEECLARAHSGRAARLGLFARILPATVEGIELRKRSLPPSGIEEVPDVQFRALSIWWKMVLA
jgi:hypothetical protein